MRQHSQRQILMIGTKPGISGGIAAVLKGYMDAGFTERFGVDYVATHRVGSPFAKLLTYVLGMVRIISTTHRYRIVHIHTASWWSFRRLYPAMFLAKAFGKKLILHLHGGQFDTYFKSVLPIERRMIQHGFGLADRVIILAGDWRNRLVGICSAEKLTIVANGVPMNATVEDPSLKSVLLPRRLLFLGEVVQRKGVYDLIDAIAAAVAKSPLLGISICGRGEIEQLRSYSQERGIASIVRFRGWVDGSEKEELMKNAHALILPSYAECLPMSILEAMAAGVPVIATRVGGIPEVITDGVDGFLIYPGDIEALSTAILQLLEDNDRWEGMARSARETAVSRFSIVETSEKLRLIYRELGADLTDACVGAPDSYLGEPSDISTGTR